MRYTLALGMGPGELCPPYSPQIQQSKIQSFYELLKTRENVIKCNHNDEGKRALKRLYTQGIHEVEILGAWAQSCISDNISEALRLGMVTYVPDEGIFFDNRLRDLAPSDLESNVTFDSKKQFRFKYEHQNGVHTFTPE